MTMYEYLFEEGQLIRDPSPNQYSKAVVIRRNYPIQYPTPLEEDLSEAQWASLREYNTLWGSESSWIGHKKCQFITDAEVSLFTLRTGIGWV